MRNKTCLSQNGRRKLRSPTDTWGDFLAGSQEWDSGLRDNRGYFGPAQMRELYKPFGDLIQQHGIGTLNTEFGVSSFVPNDVMMRYLADMLDILKEYRIGWTYLTLRAHPGGQGDFSALLDSARRDTTYKDFRGHRLNRSLMTLLQTH